MPASSNTQPPERPAAPAAPLRIAAVTCNLMLGGANTFLLNFLRALRGRPERLRVISFGEGNELAGDFEALSGDVRTARLGRLIYEDRLHWAYGETADAQPSAVLACLGAESYEMLRLASAGVVRIGLIQAHDPAPYAMAARYHASLDALVGVSHEICEHLRSVPEFREKRIVEIPYGIAFEPAAPRQPRPAGEPLRVLYLGRLIEEQKRISRIVQLVKTLEARGAPVRFTIAGAGPDEAAVRQDLSTSMIVSLPGAIPNGQVAELLRQHDVFILLSDYEGLPLSLLEAMGEGVVPIVSDLSSGIAEAVTPKSGIRVPVGDVDAPAAAILALGTDVARLSALSHAAAERARTCFSAERMVGSYLELIHSLAPATAPAWPAQISVPPPLGVPAWLYSGWRRSVRRRLKKLLRYRSLDRPSSKTASGA